MSLLGFDAIGRAALGGVASIRTTNTIFAAGVGSCAFAGVAIAFRHDAASGSAISALSGNAAGFSTILPGIVGSCAVAGKAASTPIGFAAATGPLGLTGLSALATARMASFETAYVVSGQAVRYVSAIGAQSGGTIVIGQDTGFTRGFDNWFTAPRDADEWSGRLDPGNAWLPAVMSAENWAIQAGTGTCWAMQSVRSDPWTKNDPVNTAD